MRRFQLATAAGPRLRNSTAVLASLVACAWLSVGRPAFAQDDSTPAPTEAPKKRHPAKKPAAPIAAEKKPAAPTAAEKKPDAAAGSEAAAPDPMVGQLDKAGVKTCLQTMTELGKKTLPGVAGYGRAANWQNRTPNDRIASLMLGQSYPDGSPLPKAFAMLFGSPSGKTKCDGYSVQVIPTTDKCSAVQTKILIRGKKIGDLSGVPFLNDVNGAQILLLPSAGDGCVLVGVRIDYDD